jgi:hypothetical protein
MIAWVFACPHTPVTPPLRANERRRAFRNFMMLQADATQLHVSQFMFLPARYHDAASACTPVLHVNRRGLATGPPYRQTLPPARLTPLQ